METAAEPKAGGRGRTWWRDLGRYVIAGMAATVADFLLFIILTRSGALHPLTANLISRPAGGLASFVVNKLWTFIRRPQRARLPVQFVRFWVVWLTCYAISEAGLWVWLQVLPGERAACKVLAEIGAGIVSFLLLRHWTFR